MNKSVIELRIGQNVLQLLAKKPQVPVMQAVKASIDFERECGMLLPHERARGFLCINSDPAKGNMLYIDVRPDHEVRPINSGVKKRKTTKRRKDIL